MTEKQSDKQPMLFPRSPRMWLRKNYSVKVMSDSLEKFQQKQREQEQKKHELEQNYEKFLQGLTEEERQKYEEELRKNNQERQCEEERERQNIANNQQAINGAIETHEEKIRSSLSRQNRWV